MPGKKGCLCPKPQNSHYCLSSLSIYWARVGIPDYQCPDHGTEFHILAARYLRCDPLHELRPGKLIQLSTTMFYIFMDNYLTSRFAYGSLGGMMMLTIGVAMGFSSTFLVAPAQKSFSKQSILMFNFLVAGACTAAFIASPTALFCFVPVFISCFVFGIAYPTILGLFPPVSAMKNRVG
jgi:hypothetical protein